nr:reverse transcriptase domain-containing protein [Tanacetum cinerariifolium]
TIMSDSEDSTVTYTTVSSPYEGRSGDVSPGVDGLPVMPEDPYAYVVAAFQALPPPDYVPGPKEPEQAPPSPPLPAAASPNADSPGYIPETDPHEDPEDDDEDPDEDPADYPTNHDDEEEEEEPSRDDADEEDEEQDEDDDDEEEEHPALADSIPPSPALPMHIPPPSLLTPLSSPLPQIPYPLLPIPPPILPIPLHVASPPLQLLCSDRRADRPEVTLTPQKRLSIVHCPGYEAGESSVAAVARPIEENGTKEIGSKANYKKMAPKKATLKRTKRLNPGATSNPNQAPSTTTTTITNAQLQAMIDQGVNVALAARDANRTGDDSHTSGTGGTEGVVELTQWFERMETIFCISNCLAENQVKFATCTLLAGALTGWNSHVRIFGNDAAYVMTWIELKKKMAEKYCPRNEMKKIKTEFWNLEVQGTDVTRYNQRFQELALLCVRMCPEESDRVERYIGGLTDSIHGSVAASKPKTMQE